MYMVALSMSVALNAESMPNPPMERDRLQSASVAALAARGAMQGLQLIGQALLRREVAF
jgi:hypothetical protein